MIRVSHYLSPTIHLRLHLESKYEKKSASRLLEEILDQALAAKEATRRKHMYAELRKLQGACKEKITDASTTIDETLYGENGAWRGQRE